MRRPSRRNLSGQVILITGAAGGIGRATSEELSRRGAKLMLSDIDEQALAGFASTIGIAIDTLDNPGWSLRVDLEGTSLRVQPFMAEAVEGHISWRRYWKDDVAGTFHAVGDQSSLPTLIARFRHWAEGA